MKFNRVLLMLNASLMAALLIVACGSGPTTNIVTPNPPPNPGMQSQAYGFSAIPSNHTFHLSAPSARGFSFNLIPTVHAQSLPSIVMTGNYSGYCQSVVKDTQSGTVGTILYGGGTLDPTVCENQMFFGCPQISDPSLCAAQNARDGALVIGNGTLSGLVVVDGTGSSVAAGSGTVEIAVIRSGAVIGTPIKCTLGTSARCEDSTDTFSTLDGDQVVAAISVNPGDTINNVQFFLGKQ